MPVPAKRLIRLLPGGRLRRLFWFFWLILGGVIVVFVFFYYPPASTPREDKRILEFGWNTPSLQEMPEYIEVAQSLPFDGLILDVEAPSHGQGLGWTIFGEKPIDATLLDDIAVDMADFDWGRLTDNFLRVNITPGNVDWFDDFSPILYNFETIAHFAYDMGFKGIFFDTEQYGEINIRVFDFQDVPYRDQHSYTDYAEQAYLRGQEVMQALNRGYPGITVLYPFALSHVPPQSIQDPAVYPSGLLKPFVEGMIATADDGTVLVDAFEESYGYSDETQFMLAYKRIRGLTRDFMTRDPQRYGDVMRAGFGLWVDHDCGEVGLMPEGCPNGFTPESFENALNLALKYSDRYVWIYSERVNWYTGEDIPPEWYHALGLQENYAGTHP